jgi:outer membrane protein assembly factor BamA
MGLAAEGQKPTLRAGQVIIIGNESTPQGIILNRLDLYPGQEITESALKRSQQRLRLLGVLGIVATMKIAEGDEYRDVIITVQESFGTKVIMGIHRLGSMLLPGAN